MRTTTYTVTGMTCEHCTRSVTEEVEEISGVTDVQVDLASGRLVVTAADDVTDAAVAGAVEGAGYALASS
ncbi:heavy-metal-associated domain-containing protein [Pseudokineococcus sp. 1T1Z-3]|uniref:heavy-metal-associated domain-containing protein n=1 Tax=Pseudokineococcus sp. 1T1Z-3 TaxID=3132745 RepID=UPI003098B129